MIDLSVRGLVKGFEQGNDILKGITFDVNAGERVGILGRNGCGKTTFFRILSGELQPDAGTVSIASGRRLGLISQIPVYPDGWTTEDVPLKISETTPGKQPVQKRLPLLLPLQYSTELLPSLHRYWSWLLPSISLS